MAGIIHDKGLTTYVPKLGLKDVAIAHLPALLCSLQERTGKLKVRLASINSTLAQLRSLQK